jgi:Ni/Fe-hydrogenase 1 B-type cytochrome subunit
MSNELRRVLVWPAAVRVTHWVLAAATLVLIASGWLLQTGLVATDELHERLADGLHRPAGHVFALALAVRLFLLFAGSRVARWRALIPDAVGREGIRETLRFYSRLGSARPPRYYAHNPLWGPLYLAFFGLAAVQAATGLALDLDLVRGLLPADEPSLLSLHGRLAP